MLNLNGKYKYISNLRKNYPGWPGILINRILKQLPQKLILRNGIEIIGGAKSKILDLADEIFFQKVYNPSYLQIKKGDVVVDIGANIGVFSLYAASGGAKKIFAVEPMPANIKLIHENFLCNKLAMPTTLEAAVTDKNGKAKLYLGDLDSHNLLFDHNFNNEKFSKNIMVPAITLSRIIERFKINKINFLKIDCEGSEGEIISSTPKKVWKKIDKVAIEYHDGVSSLNHTEIVAKLKKFGYKVKFKKNDEYFGYIYAF